FEFNLSLDDSDQVEIGQLSPPGSGSSSGKTPPSSSKKQRSPAPKPGSDSDVRLVPDGSDVDFEVPLKDEPATPKAPTVSTRRPTTLNPGQTKKPSTLGPPTKRPSKLSPPDSSVHMSMEDEPDSDVKMVYEAEDAVSLGPTHGKKASDSDIRLEQSKPPVKRE